MEAASYLLTNHSLSLVAKAIERDEFKPEGDLDAVLWKSSFALDWWG